jgi:hypothetical protein
MWIFGKQMYDKAPKMLAELIRAHGLPVVEKDGWSAIRGSFPVLRVSFFHDVGWHQHLDQADFQIIVGPDQTIWESFAVYGENERERVGMAFEKFSTGSLHVILAAFCNDLRAHEQVTVETWRSPDGSAWTAMIGPWHITNFDKNAGAPSVPPLFDQLQPLMEARLMDGDTHWCRILRSTVSDERVGEVLWDNDQWAEAEHVSRNAQWPAGRYTVRCFAVLRRTGESEDATA